MTHLLPKHLSMYLAIKPRRASSCPRQSGPSLLNPSAKSYLLSAECFCALHSRTTCAAASAALCTELVIVHGLQRRRHSHLVVSAELSGRTDKAEACHPDGSGCELVTQFLRLCGNVGNHSCMPGLHPVIVRKLLATKVGRPYRLVFYTGTTTSPRCRCLRLAAVALLAHLPVAACLPKHHEFAFRHIHVPRTDQGD